MTWDLHIERRFHALIFDLLNLANPKLREDKATKASTWYDRTIFYTCQWTIGKRKCISYRRGLTGVAYPLRKAMREPKRWDKQIRLPRLLVCININITHTAEHGGRSAKHSILMIHIGKQIRQKMEEHQKTVVWLAKRLSCSRANVYKIFEKYSVDTDMLARISTILNFDFFSLYSEDIKKKNSQE